MDTLEAPRYHPAPIFHLLALIKVICFAFIILFFLILGSSIRVIVPSLRIRRFLLAQLTSHISRFCLWSGRIQVITSGRSNIKKDQTYLVVGNHMGMLDILALASYVPSIFVTSIELKETPVVGWLTEAGGCVFVERRNRHNIHAEVDTIRSALSGGSNVVVFPEAKSTNGDFVHPFKKSLFVSAAGSTARVLPVTINYLEINRQSISQSNRDYICWYGDQSFHSALWRLMMNSSIKIELIFHPSLALNTAEDRHQIAQLSHSSVQSKFVSLNR